MKKLTLTGIAIALSVLSSQALADTEKRISEKFMLDAKQSLSIDVPVGRIEINIVDSNEVSLEIEVKGKDQGWFKSDKDVSHVALGKHVSSGKVKLEIDEDDTNQEWVLNVPKFAALDIELGVGEVEINNLANSADVEVGVGEVTIQTQLDDFKKIELESGVGETQIKGFSGEIDYRRKVVSSEVTCVGKGEYSINAEVGVGEVKVKK